MSKFKYKIVSAADPRPNFNNSNNQSGIFTPNEFRLQSNVGFEYWNYPQPVSQAEFTTPGTYLWTCPDKVFSVSVVCVGGGGGGSIASGYADSGGGGGGGLGWKNNIPVIPGTSYTVVVGAGGSASSIALGSGSVFFANPDAKGGDSYFISTSIVAGFGGSSGVITANANGGSYAGEGGGTGGFGRYVNPGQTVASGGGGAGGYSGNGGNGGAPTAAATDGVGGGGGGGGGQSIGFNNTRRRGAGGGGVGIYGQGTNGAAGTSFGSTSVNGNPGTGGSAGTAGTNGSITAGGIGGLYGGGGAGFGSSTTTANYGAGGKGAVRIIWGPSRAFPDTNTVNI